MRTEDISGSALPIACNPDAIPAARRDQWAESSKRIFAAVQEIQEMTDGYGFRLPPDSTMILSVAEYIANERLCCPFFHFMLELEPDEGPFWLRLTGGAGVKEYLWSLLETSDLLNEQVIRSADIQEERL